MERPNIDKNVNGTRQGKQLMDLDQLVMKILGDDISILQDFNINKKNISKVLETSKCFL